MVYKPTNITGGPHPAWLLVFVGEIFIFHCDPMSYVTSEGQKSAQESPSSVEAWVVRAISEGVIDGRIDQLNRKVWQFQRCCWGMRCSLVGGLEHFLLFPYIGNNNPNCLLFFRGVETTNQMRCSDFGGVQAPFDGGSSASISLVESLIDRNISCLTDHFSRGLKQWSHRSGERVFKV